MSGVRNRRNVAGFWCQVSGAEVVVEEVRKCWRSQGCQEQEKSWGSQVSGVDVVVDEVRFRT